MTLTFLNRTPACSRTCSSLSKSRRLAAERLLHDSEGRISPQHRDQRTLEATGAGSTPSRQRIFVCRPKSTEAKQQAACARTIVLALARRAFRRPVVDTDIQTVLASYEEGQAARDFELGIERAVEGLLVSPEFLYRIEREP